MTAGTALWARPACDPDVPAEFRELLARGDRLGRAERRRRDKLLARHRDLVIFPQQLDPDVRRLLARAQQAISAILRSDIRAVGLLAADEPVLRRHEWDIAAAALRFTAVTAQASDQHGGDQAGEMTAAVLGAQQRALAVARAATEKRVAALEEYAGQVAAADAARRDWQSAIELAGLNDSYLDLVARTAADGHAIAELRELTGDAALTTRALRESLRQAAEAADVIALSPRAG